MRSAYNYDRELVSHETAISCPPEEDRTQQQFKEEADINTIVARVKRGDVPPFFPGTYGDFSNVPNFHAAMNQVLAARESFMRLPARIRRRFDNSPAELVDFLSDPANLQEAIELKIVEKPKPEAEDGGAGSVAQPAGSPAEAGGTPA